jgi:hypothetical protein
LQKTPCTGGDRVYELILHSQLYGLPWSGRVGLEQIHVRSGRWPSGIAALQPAAPPGLDAILHQPLFYSLMSLPAVRRRPSLLSRLSARWRNRAPPVHPGRRRAHLASQ